MKKPFLAIIKFRGALPQMDTTVRVQMLAVHLADAIGQLWQLSLKQADIANALSIEIRPDE